MKIGELSRQAQKEMLERMAKDEESPFEVTNAELDELLQVVHAQRDYEMIALCDEVLCRRHGIRYEEVEAETGEAFRRQLKARMRAARRKNQVRTVWQSRGLRFASMCAALIAVIVSVEHISSRWTIRQHSTPDGQEWVAEPGKLAKPVISVAEAEGGEDETWTVYDLDSLYQRLGYKLPLPGWMPEDVSLKEIDGYREKAYDAVDIRYVGDGDKLIIASYYKYYNADYVTVSFEQDEEGKKIKIENGEQAYVASNMGVYWGLLTRGNMQIQVSCRGYDRETLMQILNSIGV